MDPKRRTWTTTEVAYLRQHYAETPNDVLAKALGVTPKAVLKKASALLLHKSPAFLARQRAARPAPVEKLPPGILGIRRHYLMDDEP